MESGELFECRLETDAGAVEMLAEVHVGGTTLELRDVVIYPASDELLSVGASGLLTAARTQLFPGFVELGFETLIVTGTRLTGSRRGRRVRVRVDLTREVT